jgi:hypothetical protein
MPAASFASFLLCAAIVRQRGEFGKPHNAGDKVIHSLKWAEKMFLHKSGSTGTTGHGELALPVSFRLHFCR